MARLPLSTIVGQFLDKYNYGEAEYAKAYRMAIRGWRQLNWDVTGELKREKLQVECDLTVCLPDDLIKLLRIGVVNSKGEIATLTENPNLTDLSCDDYADTSNNFGDWWTHDNNWKVLGWGGSLGVGSDTNIGEYRFDEGSNRAILNPEFCYSEVTIEYNGHPKIKGEYTINELASEALTAFIEWQWSAGMKGLTISEKEAKRRDYYNELRLAKGRIKMPTLQTMKSISRRLTMQGVKA